MQTQHGAGRPYWPVQVRTKVWTQEDDDAIRRMRAENLSYTAIGERLGVTRNAAVGRAGRIGLTKRRQSSQLDRTSKVPLPAGPPKLVKIPKPNAAVKPGPTPSDGMTDVRATVGDVARIRPNDLEPHHCRWPIGNPRSDTFGFCGCQKVDGSSYCAAHRARSVRSDVPMRPVYLPAALAR